VVRKLDPWNRPLPLDRTLERSLDVVRKAVVAL
jgi:hypothetical protein